MDNILIILIFFLICLPLTHFYEKQTGKNQDIVILRLVIVASMSIFLCLLISLLFTDLVYTKDTGLPKEAILESITQIVAFVGATSLAIYQLIESKKRDEEVRKEDYLNRKKDFSLEHFPIVSISSDRQFSGQFEGKDYKNSIRLYLNNIGRGEARNVYLFEEKEQSNIKREWQIIPSNSSQMIRFYCKNYADYKDNYSYKEKIIWVIYRDCYDFFWICTRVKVIVNKAGDEITVVEDQIYNDYYYIEAKEELSLEKIKGLFYERYPYLNS